MSSCFLKHLALRYYVVLFILTLSLYLVTYCYRSREMLLGEFNSISATETASVAVSVKKRFSKAENLLKEMIKSNGFLAATRTNYGGKISSGTVCAVDPALTDCLNMGFGAFLLRTLDDIVLCQALGSDQTVVYWRGCYSVCSRDPRVNSWLWYFEPLSRGLSEFQVERILCPLLVTDNEYILQSYPHLRSISNNSFKNRSNVDGFEDDRIITTQERWRVNQLIQQYIQPNDKIKRMLNIFYHRYMAGNAVLGVHVRGTDHWMETSDKRLPPLMSWVKSAQSILKTLPPPRKIFIASDNDEVIKKFVAFFGKYKVVFTRAIRAKTYHGPLAPHDFQFEDNPADPYERVIGTQVLLDILLLAKCDYFLHAESSLASLASYFNPAMKSYFVDEKQVKGQRKLLSKSRIDEESETEQEETEEPAETEEDQETLECFQRNSLASACPNAAKGKFVNLTEAQNFLKRYS